MLKKLSPVVLLALVLTTGCSSPEQPRAAAADNQDSAASSPSPASAELPGYIDCIQAPAVEPDSISLDCSSDDDYVTDISWESWGKNSARGTGTRVQTSGSQRSESQVTIELSQPITATMGWAFSQRDIATADASATSTTSSAVSSTAPAE